LKYLSVLFFAATVFCGGTTVLTEDADTYCCDIAVTDWGAVIYVNEEGLLSILNPDYTGDPITMTIDWGRELGEWGETGRVFDLSASPDGRNICFAQMVAVPAEYVEEDSYVPYPLIVATCRSDGMAPRLLGLSFEVGSGPHFCFTQDSRYVYGGPWLECDPDPASFVGYFSGDDSCGLTPWLMVDAATGTRSGDPSVIGDGFLENPCSDLVAAGWYPPNTIVDILTQQVLLEDTSIHSPAIIDTWVLPDAGLARDADGNQLLRFADGTSIVNPGSPVDVYCRLSDGRFLFTDDGGGTVMLGSIALPDFSSPDAVRVPWLDGLYSGTAVHELPGDAGVVYLDGGDLVLAELP